MKEHDDISRQAGRSNHRFFGAIAGLAASIIIMFGLWNYAYRSPDSYIYLDINPSLNLVTNKMDKVIEIKTYNDIDYNLFKDINYKNQKLDQVLEKLIEKLDQDKYMEEENYLLLTVYNKDLDRQVKKQRILRQQVSDLIEKEKYNSYILSQDLIFTRDLEKEAEHYNISPSKMNLINNMLDLNKQLEKENLISLSIRELLAVSKAFAMDLDSILVYKEGFKISDSNILPKEKIQSDKLPVQEDKKEMDQKDNNETKDTSHGTDKEKITNENEESKDSLVNKKKMISLEEAKEIGLNYVGGGKLIEIELEIDKYKAEYEIEIIRDDKKYELEIDAYTGKILEIQVKEAKDKDRTKDPINIGAMISLERAEEIALSLTKGGSIKESKLEIEKDKAKYEIEILKDGKEYEVEIDAYTGEVLDFDED